MRDIGGAEYTGGETDEIDQHDEDGAELIDQQIGAGSRSLDPQQRQGRDKGQERGAGIERGAGFAARHQSNQQRRDCGDREQERHRIEAHPCSPR